MSITQEQINKLAINLNKLKSKDEEKLLKSVNFLLKYVDLLNEVDTTNIPSTINIISKKNNILRKDDISPDILPKDLLNCSPQKVIANQIAVNDIMK